MDYIAQLEFQIVNLSGHPKPIEELIHDLSSIKTEVVRKAYFDYVDGIMLNDIETISSTSTFRRYIKMLKLFKNGEKKLSVISNVEDKIRTCGTIIFNFAQLKKIAKQFIGDDENMRYCFRILKEHINDQRYIVLPCLMNNLDIYEKTAEDFLKYIVENKAQGFIFNLSTLYTIIQHLHHPSYRKKFIQKVFLSFNMKFFSDISPQDFLKLEGISSQEHFYINENLITQESYDCADARSPMSSTGRVMVTPQPIKPITATEKIMKIGNLIENILLCAPSSEVSFSPDYKEAFSNSLRYIYNQYFEDVPFPSPTIRRILFSDGVTLTTTSQEGMKLIEGINSQLKLICDQGAFVFGGTLMQEEEPTKPTPQNDNDEVICSICLERKRNVLFRPCSHFCSCSRCSMRLENCPICRTRIRRKIMVFVS